MKAGKEQNVPESEWGESLSSVHTRLPKFETERRVETQSDYWLGPTGSAPTRFRESDSDRVSLAMPDNAPLVDVINGVTFPFVS